HVDARAEPDEPHALALRHALALATVRDDATRDQSGDLSHQDAVRAGLDADRRLLVLAARCLGARVQELAGDVTHGLHDTGYRIAVHVHAEDVHEDRHARRAAADE